MTFLLIPAGMLCAAAGLWVWIVRDALRRQHEAIAARRAWEEHDLETIRQQQALRELRRKIQAKQRRRAMEAA